MFDVCVSHEPHDKILKKKNPRKDRCVCVCVLEKREHQHSIRVQHFYVYGFCLMLTDHTDFPLMCDKSDITLPDNKH